MLSVECLHLLNSLPHPRSQAPPRFSRPQPASRRLVHLLDLLPHPSQLLNRLPHPSRHRSEKPQTCQGDARVEPATFYTSFLTLPAEASPPEFLRAPAAVPRLTWPPHGGYLAEGCGNKLSKCKGCGNKFSKCRRCRSRNFPGQRRRRPSRTWLSPRPRQCLPRAQGQAQGQASACPSQTSIQQ